MINKIPYKYRSILIRAFKTFCQTAASMIVVGVGFEDVNWIRIISVSLVAFIASVLTNLGGTPESTADGCIRYTTDKDGNPIAEIKANQKFEELYMSGKEFITMRVIDDISGAEEEKEGV